MAKLTQQKQKEECNNTNHNNQNEITRYQFTFLE